MPVAPAPVKTVLQGFCIGTADIIPGVSGGTMALVLGIYQRLIRAIRSFDGAGMRLLCRCDWRALWRHLDLPFVLLLLLGIATALLFFTRVLSLPTLMDTRPGQIYGLFFGLISGSIVVLFFTLERLRRARLGCLLAGCLLGLVVVNSTPTGTPEAAWFLFLCGFLAICATLLPGISGSFVLLLLQKYAYVMQAIATLQLVVLAPFALGVVTGALLFSRFMAYLLRHYWQATTCFMLGLLLASLWLLWPFRAHHLAQGSGAVWSVWGLMLLGFVAVAVLHRLAARPAPDASAG